MDGFECFALRHRATGKWMPARMFSGASGWSYWEPTTDDKPRDPGPRLFFTLTSARNAASAWAQGYWRRHTETEGSWEEGYYDVSCPPIPTPTAAKASPPVTRSFHDLEIVPMLLVPR